MDTDRLILYENEKKSETFYSSCRKYKTNYNSTALPTARGVKNNTATLF